MIETTFFDDIALGGLARIQRVCWRLTQQDMANITGVPQKDIELFETDQCLSPITKRRLLRVYDLVAETDTKK
jgi:hypothetical protein